MSTLPPQPARRSYVNPAPTTFDEDDYGTSDFLIPESPKVVFGGGTNKSSTPEPSVEPTPIPPVAVPPVSKPVIQEAPRPARPAPRTSPTSTVTAPPTRETVTPVAAPAVQEEPSRTDISPRTSAQDLHPVAASIDNALYHAPAMIDKAMHEAPVLIGNIVDHYSEQGKKDRLIANTINGSALVTLISGVLGPQMLALPFVLAIIGLGWGKKARRNGMSTTLSSFMGWTVIAVSVSGIVIAAAVVGVAAFFFK